MLSAKVGEIWIILVFFRSYCGKDYVYCSEKCENKKNFVYI